jgi:hypothetical protein
MSKAWAFSGAVAKLREPLAHLDGLDGLPPSLIRRCQVTMRGEEAKQLVPEPLRHEWSSGALEKWTAHFMMEDQTQSLTTQGYSRHRIYTLEQQCRITFNPCSATFQAALALDSTVQEAEEVVHLALPKLHSLILVDLFWQ